MQSIQLLHTSRYLRRLIAARAACQNLRLRYDPPSRLLLSGNHTDCLQITCLFWFESTVTLTLVEDPRYPLPRPASPLVPEAMPTTGFRKWVTTILSMTQVSQNVILLALMFIYRLKRLNPGVKGKIGSEFRLLTVALMLGNKCEL